MRPEKRLVPQSQTQVVAAVLDELLGTTGLVVVAPDLLVGETQDRFGTGGVASPAPPLLSQSVIGLAAIMPDVPLSRSSQPWIGESPGTGFSPRWGMPVSGST